MNVTTFEYRAIAADGQTRRGVTQAPNVDEAIRRLTKSGLSPVKVTPARLRRRQMPGRRGVGLRDLSLFTFQFAVLIEARIPISEGLRSIAQEEPNPTLRDAVNELAVSIETGATITEAMSQRRDLFGETYIEMIRAAEQSGNLVKILEYLAEMLDREVERQASLRSAMMYPACVVSALFLAVCFLMIVVLPRFVKMFDAQNVELPAPTKILLGITEVVSQYWWMAGGLAVVSVFAFIRFVRTPKGKTILERQLNRIPIIKNMLQAAALGRFAHVFGLALSSGLRLIDSLEMAGRASGRSLLLNDARYLANHVSEGGRLGDAVSKCPYLTGFVRRLLSAGEQSAELPSTCRIIAKHYDREMKYLTRNVSTLIEPLVVVVMAGVVLFVALSIFMPMWNTMSLMK